MADVMLIIHIMSAATWFGANMVQFYVTPRMRKADNGAAAAWHRMVVSLGKGLYSPAVVLLFISGFGLLGMSDGAYATGDTFVLIGIVMVVVGAVLGMRFFGPQAEKAALAYDNDDRSGAEAIVGRVAFVAAIETILLVVTFVAMVLQWGV